jgi:hypothetical protein
MQDQARRRDFDAVGAWQVELGTRINLDCLVNDVTFEFLLRMKSGICLKSEVRRLSLPTCAGGGLFFITSTINFLEIATYLCAFVLCRLCL